MSTETIKQLRAKLAAAESRIETLRSGLRQIAVGEYDVADYAAARRRTAENYLEMDDEDARRLPSKGD